MESGTQDNKQRNIIVAVVAVLVLLCCCCAVVGAIGWMFGDSIMRELDFSRALPLLANL